MNRTLLKHGVEVLWKKIGEYKDGLTTVIQLRFILMLIIAVAVILPLAFVDSLAVTFWLSVLVSLILVFLLVNAVYYCVRGLNDVGFDPDGVVVMFQGDGETWLNLFIQAWHGF
jgi:cation transporter-like permease